MPERYLTIPEVAERLGTTERLPRRFIEERRIEFVRHGGTSASPRASFRPTSALHCRSGVAARSWTEGSLIGGNTTCGKRRFGIRKLPSGN